LSLAFGVASGHLEIIYKGACRLHDWSIEWASKGGNKQPLQVGKNNLVGSNVSVAIETIQDGGIVFGPLTGEFLQVAESAPQVKKLSKKGHC